LKGKIRAKIQKQKESKRKLNKTAKISKNCTKIVFRAHSENLQETELKGRIKKSKKVKKVVTKN